MPEQKNEFKFCPICLYIIYNVLYYAFELRILFRRIRSFFLKPVFQIRNIIIHRHHIMIDIVVEFLLLSLERRRT